MVGSDRPRSARSRIPGRAVRRQRRAIDRLADLEPLRVVEAPSVSSVRAKWDAQVVGKPPARRGRPRTRSRTAAQGANRDPGRGRHRTEPHEVARVVPPLGQSIVRRRRRVAGRRGPDLGRRRRFCGGGIDGRGAGGLARIGPSAQPATRTATRRNRTAPLTGPPPLRSRLRTPAVGSARKRSSDAGIHQFQRPSSRIVDGTSSARTTVASKATAIATPSPSALIRTMSAKANDPATTTTISAAEVTIRPLRSRPRATASVLSPVVSQTSFIRDRRKTS